MIIFVCAIILLSFWAFMHLPFASSPTPPAPQIAHSQKSTSGLVELQAEDSLFSVPSEELEQLKAFIDLYDVTSAAHKQSTVNIKDIKAHEFKVFLKLLIRPPLRLPEHELTESELESALKLSTEWNFGAVRSTAISRLEALPLDASRLIQLAHLYNVDHWIAQGIERLAIRPESLSIDEAERVGLKTAIEISAKRDSFAQLKLERLPDEEAARAVAESMKVKEAADAQAAEIVTAAKRTVEDIEDAEEYLKRADAAKFAPLKEMGKALKEMDKANLARRTAERVAQLTEGKHKQADSTLQKHMYMSPEQSTSAPNAPPRGIPTPYLAEVPPCVQYEKPPSEPLAPPSLAYQMNNENLLDDGSKLPSENNKNTIIISNYSKNSNNTITITCTSTSTSTSTSTDTGTEKPDPLAPPIKKTAKVVKNSWQSGGKGDGQ